MSVELHLPDLPEVPISLGHAHGHALGHALGDTASARTSLPLRWHQRLRDALSSYLPLLLMAVLALGSWWLVKNVPAPIKPRDQGVVRTAPDYTMTDFVLERFEPTGRLKLRIAGTQLRHYPDTDRIEIDALQLRAISPDGHVTLAQAKRALSNGDGSEVQLMGAARVDSVDKQGEPLAVSSEFLHLFTVSERLRTHLPVLVQRGGAELHAAAMYYDHALGRIELIGAQRAVFPPRAPPRR